jgi:hypothetical protein
MNAEVIAMIKKLLIGACLVLPVAACTTAPVVPDANAQLASADQKAPPFGCVAQTGTRLPVKADACTGFGAQYTKTDVDQTGKPWLQQSLQMMDTTVKIGPGTASVQ